MRNRFDNEPPRRRDVPEDRYLRDDTNREFDDPRAYQDFDEAVYGDHKSRQAREDRDYSRRSAMDTPRRSYHDDHEANEARRYWQNRDNDYSRSHAQSYGPRSHPAHSQREQTSINPYSDVDRPLFTGGQLNEDSVPSTQRMDHGFDPDYLHWRENELTRHDTAYRDWRAAQASNYDTAYSTWRKSRQDQFHKDFNDWRSSQASATTGQNPVTASISSDKDKSTSK